MSGTAVELVFSRASSSSPRLPAIGDDTNLVSRPITQSSDGLKDASKNEKVEETSQTEDEVVTQKRKLKKLISRAFITALHQSKDLKCWNHLGEVLQLVEPYLSILNTKELCHYAERAYLEIEGNKDLQDVCSLIQRVFVDVVANVQNADKKKSKFPSVSDENVSLTLRRKTVSKGVKIPKTELKSVMPSSCLPADEQPSYNPKRAKELSLNDLRFSLTEVVKEISARESVLGVPLGMTILALDVNLPPTHTPSPPPTPKPMSATPQKQVCFDSEDKKSTVKKEATFIPRTGMEIVEEFIKGSFLGELKFAYVNFAPSERYNPYHLIEVPKDRVNPEHFIISSHSILHIFPDKPSESQLISDWYIEASTFHAVMNLSLFKNFFLRKAFMKLKNAKKFTYFRKTKADIEKSLIPNVQTFGSALLRISSLLNDLSKVTFLPFDTKSCYTLREFEELTFKTSDTGRMYVNKFFAFSQMIVDKTQSNCFEYLKYCETQIKNHQHNYKESLSVAKEKKAIRQKNLKLAHEEVAKLGNFVNLVDHIIIQNLITMAQSNICKFVDVTLPGPRPEREGLFKVGIMFNDNHKLALSPSTKQLAYSLSSALEIVLSVVCSLSHAMELDDVTKSFIAKAKGDSATPDTKTPRTANNKHPESTVQFSSRVDVVSETGQLDIYSYSNLKSQDDISIQIMRSEDEILDDIQDFSTSIGSARDVKPTNQELCSKRPQENVLVVQGHKLEPCSVSNSPLTKEKLQQTLYSNDKIKDALKYHQELVSEAVEEVTEFCENHNWLSEIHEFVTGWDDTQIEYWKSQPTTMIEQQLRQIQTWTQQVGGVIKKFSTANGLLYINCIPIQDIIIPKLSRIFNEMVVMVASQVLILSGEVVMEMENLAESIKEQRTEIKFFALFIKELKSVKDKVPALKDKVEYIKNLFEVIRGCFRQLTAEEEITEEKVWACWESFLFGLQEASDFIQIQKPVVTERLHETIASMEEQVFGIGHRAMSGRFIDPDEMPSKVLSDLRQLRDRGRRICNELKMINMWNEIITESTYDMTEVLVVMESIEKRLELWRYYDVCSNRIKDWTNSAFIKLNVRRIIDTVKEWQAACDNLKAYIDEDDNVLTALISKLHEFSKDLPLLLQLSDEALKQRHWRALFIGMGQEFDQSMKFTTTRLLEMNLTRYKELIETVCNGASHEHELEIELQQLIKSWLERDFKLAKHIPSMRPKMDDEHSKKTLERQKEKKRKMTLHEKTKTKAKPKTAVADSFIVIGIPEIKCMIEDNLVTLQSMLASPYVTDVIPIVEEWTNNLTELEDILNVWETCQIKWLYLTNVFSEPQMARKYAEHLESFKEIDKKYQDLIDVISKNSRVTSILTKKRGELGWRELQGEALRAMLLELIQKEEELIIMVKEYFELARAEFPRLYLLGDKTLLDLLAWSRNPKDLLPFVKMCFPGIKGLEFKLPEDIGVKLTSALDAALNVHLLEVIGMEGSNSEQVSLIRPIPASPVPQKWFVNLEQSMRDTLMNELSRCVRTRLHDGALNFTSLVEQLIQRDNVSGENEPVEDKQPLLGFPAQCVGKAEDVLWARKVSHALVSGRQRNLSIIRTEIKCSIEDLSSAIRKSIECPSDNPEQNRIEVISANLLAQAVSHRDIVDALIEDHVTNIDSFEWQSQLKSKMEITEEISTSYDGKDNTSELPVEKTYRIGRCALEQLVTSVPYGYEYQGPSTGLVVTPLARRCFLSLNMALQSFKCGTLHGPNGTGKTETIQHLSKILGRHLVTVNCTSSLESSTLVGYLLGMLRSGSWICLENIDSMNTGVLSVFGQHLEKIRLSLKTIKRDLHSQYTVRGNSDKNLERRPSIVSLTPLHGKESVWIKDEICQEINRRRRRLSSSELDSFLDPSTITEPSSLVKTYQDKKGSYRYRNTSPLAFTMPEIGHMVFNNKLIGVSQMYGCFMTMSSYRNNYTEIPENFKALLRPVAMVVPDAQAVLEVTMSCCGFTESQLLAKKLHSFFTMISDQISSQNDLSLRSMLTVVRYASHELRKELKRKATNDETNSINDNEAPVRSPFLESFERRQTEENSLVHALFCFFGNKLWSSDKDIFSNTVDAVFIHSVLMSVISEGEPELCDEIKEHFVSHGFQVKPELMAKTVQLYKSIKSAGNVIVIGSSGSGKTTLYQALAGAINNLHTQLLSTTKVGPKKTTTLEEKPPTRAWPMLDVTVVFPKSLTNDELFGHLDVSTNAWRDGLISKFFRDSILTSRTKKDVLKMTSEEKQRTLRGLRDVSHVEKWLVLDGPMDDLWLGGMSTVLDSSKTLSLGEGGSVSVPDTVSIIFETTDLCNVSPSLVTCCSIVHCPDELIGWKAIFRPWIKSAYSKWEISNRGLGIISSLMDHVVETTLVFLEQHCKTVLTADFGSTTPSPSPARGVYEVQSILRYLTAIFDRHILREDDSSQVVEQQKGRISVAGSSHSRNSSGITPGDTDKVISTFVFAFVWSFGGHLQDSFAQAFDEHARQVLSSGPYPANIPSEGLVYDYYLDFPRGTLIKWEERPGAQFKTFATSYTVVPEFDRYFFLMDLMITAGRPVLLVGQPGSGKSALVQNLISPRHSYQRIFMSFALTSKLFQEAIEAKLSHVDRRDLNDLTLKDALLVTKTKSKSVLYFLDDLNYANTDANNTQPPLELLRQILTHGCLYDKQRQQYYPVKNAAQFISTAVPPSATGVGGGVASHVLSPCLTRRMTVLSFFPASPQTLTAIYSGIFLTWLKGFPAYSMTHHAIISKAMAAATISLFNKIREELRPSPLYPHFVFNQHDLSRIADSFTLFSSSSRGRKRPRVRKRGGGAARTVRVKTTQLEEITATLMENDRGFEGEPTIATPALLSPIIRSLFRLWCHENTRTYCDRLLSDNQRYWFSTVLNDVVMEHFCQGVEDLTPPEQPEQPERDSLFPVISRESIGVAPGTSAPPPSAKISRCSNIVDKPEQEEETGAEDEEVLLEQSEHDIEKLDDIEVKENENVCGEDGKEDADQVVEKTVSRDDEQNQDAGSERSASSVDSHHEEPINEAECTFGGQSPKIEETADVSKDVEDKEYKGPLITFRQLALPGEDLTDIMFCKHFVTSSMLSTTSSTSNTTRGYTECFEEALEQGMKKCISSYNSQSIKDRSFKKINMVTFREALRHASRISRALAIEGGHALLLSHQGYGRRTLTRLAAHAARYTLIEVQNTPFQGQGELRQQIKEASYIAGLQGKPVVLFVPEDQTDESLQDICTVMVEGTCPGLYTKNELNMITSNLLPVGQRGIRRVEHLDIAQERFFRRVKSHLHVVICMKYSPLLTSKSPSQSQLYRFPILLTRCCCVDTFVSWPHEALTSIAEKLIDVSDPNQGSKKGKDSAPNTSALCSIMAHVHTTSRAMAQKLYGSKGLKLYSPDSYLDFVVLFKKFYERLCEKEKAKVNRLKNGISRMDEAHETISRMKTELADLAPVFQEAQESVQQCHDDVETSQAEYHDQKEMCKKKELEIQKLQEPVDSLKKETNEQFGKVSPLFYAAYNAINALDVHDVEEIRSYRVPPLLVEMVVNCICLLFNTPQTWSEGKLLLNRDNFFKDLEFYNMKEMPDPMFRKLETYYNNPSFKPKIVKAGSGAAGSLCMWARAVYEYCIVYRALKPKRMQLKRAEALLEEAKAALGEMRVRYNEIKKELEKRIQTYKDSMKHLKNTEKKIQTINGRKSRAENLVGIMSESSESWKTLLCESQQNLVTAPGDSLIIAASVCYLGALDHNARLELFNDWLRVCDGQKREMSGKKTSLVSMILHNNDSESKKTSEPVKSPSKSRNASSTSRNTSSIASINVIPVRDNLSLADVLVEKDELVEWVNRGLPNDQHAIQNALIMRMCYDRAHCWPLLIDPHGQAEMWVRAVVDAKPISSVDDRCKSARGSGSRPSTPLDYPELEPPEEDLSIAEDICNEDSLVSDVDEQSVVLDGRDTSLTDHSTDVSDKSLKEKIAREMGIQSRGMTPISTATPNLEVREGQVMVVSADDSQLVSKIRAAVISGVVVLVTHMERRRFSKKLELLLSRQTFVDKNKDVKLSIGKSIVSYHPSFRLFMSSSMPMYMRGEGLVPLPLSKTCVVDMSFSQQGLTDRLLMETLTLERPEYEGQKRSLERDLTLHQQQIATAQVFILDKVLELKTPLLSDPNIFNNVEKSKNIINTARDRYEEAKTMEKQLHDKRGDFLPVASYGAMLYTIICQLSKVQPYCYYTPLDNYLRLFHDTILNRKRNKKSIGSSSARAAELTSALSRAVYTRISWGLFLSDNLLFPFLISIEKLLNEGGITEDEWRLFIRRPSAPDFLRTVGKESNKPSWITQQTWLFVNELESLPNLSNIRKSLIDNSDEWKEYFLLPPVLLANTPGNHPRLSVFQKALLWKVFREDQVHQICQDLVLYILGASMIHPIEYDIQQVYSVSTSATPIVFLLPSHATVFSGSSVSIKDPYEEISNLAQAHQKSGWIMTVCLGESKAMEQALHAVHCGMERGYWVVIHNAELADEWSKEFIEALQVITTTYQVIDDNEDDEIYSIWTDDPELRTPQSHNRLSAVHPEFRLFVTARVGSGRPLPAVLIQRGLKLACEAKATYRSIMKQTFEVGARCINSWTRYWNKPFSDVIKSPVPQYAIYVMAYLHSTLHYRRQHGQCAFVCPYEWNYSDIHGSCDLLRHLSCVLSQDTPVQLVKVLDMIAWTVYTGHVFDKMDALAVRSIAQSLANSQALQGTIDNQESVDDTLQSFPESLSIEQLGLAHTSITHYSHQRSSSLRKSVQTIMEIKQPQFSLEEVIQKLNQVKNTIQKLVYDTSQPNQTEPISAISSFFLKEAMFYTNFLHQILKELGLLSMAIDGQIANTPFLHSLLVDIYHCKVPLQWSSKCGGPYDLGQWIEWIVHRVLGVHEYSICTPCVVSLGLLTHQQAFLSCLMVDYVKASNKSSHSLSFQIKIMPMSFEPNTTPDSGIYVSGLSVCNASWDSERSCLVGGPGLVTELPVVLLTLQVDSKTKLSSGSDLVVYDCPLRSNVTNDLLTSLPLISALSVEELRKRKVSLVT